MRKQWHRVVHRFVHALWWVDNWVLNHRLSWICRWENSFWKQ